MIPCPKCGHQNLPGYGTCSRCAAPLHPGGEKHAAVSAATAAAQDQARQLFEERARITKRNRTISIGIAVLAFGFLAFRFVRDRQVKGDVQAKLDYVSRWVELEKRETGLFWNCVMASEVDVGMFGNAGQVQQRIEAAYATQMQTFSQHLMTECVPKIERAKQAFAGLDAPPEELRVPLESYKASLPEMQKGIELYAERIRDRGNTKDVDQLIQQAGDAWHSETRPTPRTIAFEKFMHCAVPGLTGLKDAQQMLEFLATQCFKKDPVSFMDRVRKDCGPILVNEDPNAKPSKTYRQSHTKFYEEEARQLSAWADCGRKARKGKKVEDLGEFLVAVGDYMAARSGVVEAARALSPK